MSSSLRVLLHHLGECCAELCGALPVGVLVVLGLLLDPLEPLVQLRALVKLGAVDGLHRAEIGNVENTHSILISHLTS